MFGFTEEQMARFCVLVSSTAQEYCEQEKAAGRMPNSWHDKNFLEITQEEFDQMPYWYIVKYGAQQSESAVYYGMCHPDGKQPVGSFARHWLQGYNALQDGKTHKPTCFDANHIVSWGLR